MVNHPNASRDWPIVSAGPRPADRSWHERWRVSTRTRSSSGERGTDARGARACVGFAIPVAESAQSAQKCPRLEQIAHVRGKEEGAESAQAGEHLVDRGQGDEGRVERHRRERTLVILVGATGASVDRDAHVHAGIRCRERG